MEKKKFIDIRRLIASKNPRLIKWIPGFIINYLKRILHQDEINAFLDEHHDKYDADFAAEVIHYFKIKIKVKGLENIPKNGPVIITMNHPLGGMDALAFITALKDHRKDLRFIVNDLLMNLENLKGLFVGVNKHGKNERSTRQNITDIFESDNAVCIFPAGLVSRKSNGIVKDLEWKKTFVTYAKKFDHPLVPVHIDGELSKWFYGLAKFRQFLRIKANIEMLYLADEMFKQKGKTMKITIGEPFYVKDTIDDSTERDYAQTIKEQVYDLPLHKKH